MTSVTEPRIVAIVLEVEDLDRSERLYREGFGLDLHPSEHEDDDRWIGGRHAALSWTDVAFLHFASTRRKAWNGHRERRLGLRSRTLRPPRRVLWRPAPN